MTRSILVAFLSIAAACGGGSKPAPTAPIADPIPMAEAPTEPTPGVDPVKPTEPAVPEPPAAPDPAKVKADLLAAEMTAYENVKPLVGKYCASCHTKGQKGAKAKTLEHFETTAYPFGGHHAMEVGKNVRKVLGIDGSKPTMPKNKPGIVKGDELALFASWADAFDASHAGGAHEGHGTGGGHDHSSMNHDAPAPANAKPTTPPAKVAAAPARFDIAVTSAGFEPKNVNVPRGRPVVLRFERRVERTCGTEVVMSVDGQKIEKDLPLNKPVEVAITFGTAGTVKYSCAMDMIRGTITVQ
jgi:plastocyanin